MGCASSKEADAPKRPSRHRSSRTLEASPSSADHHHVVEDDEGWTPIMANASATGVAAPLPTASHRLGDSPAPLRPEALADCNQIFDGGDSSTATPTLPTERLHSQRANSSSAGDWAAKSRRPSDPGGLSTKSRVSSSSRLQYSAPRTPTCDDSNPLAPQHAEAVAQPQATHVPAVAGNNSSDSRKPSTPACLDSPDARRCVMSRGQSIEHPSPKKPMTPHRSPLPRPALVPQSPNNALLGARLLSGPQLVKAKQRFDSLANRCGVQGSGGDERATPPAGRRLPPSPLFLPSALADVQSSSDSARPMLGTHAAMDTPLCPQGHVVHLDKPPAKRAQQAHATVQSPNRGGCHKDSPDQSASVAARHGPMPPPALPLATCSTSIASHAGSSTKPTPDSPRSIACTATGAEGEQSGSQSSDGQGSALRVGRYNAP